MSRPKSPNRDESFKIYKKNNGKITSKEIAKILDEKLNNINTWRVKDKWNKRLKPGAPMNNKNALGHKGKLPKKNQNARITGAFSKYYPNESMQIINKLEKINPTMMEYLISAVETQYAAILRSQQIMYVKDHNDMTKELKKIKVQKDYVGPKGAKTLEETYREEEYELQFAWDKQATFLNAQSRAITTLKNLIKQCNEMIMDGLATEEQKLRIEKIQVSISSIKEDLKFKKEIAKEKLQLEKDRFEHQKEMDDKNNW